MGSKCMILAMILAGLVSTFPAAADPDPISPTVNSASQQIVEDLMRQCASLACRTSERHFSLRTRDGKTVEGTTARFPYVNDKGTIFVYPGETVGVSITRDGDRLTPPVFAAATDPDGTTASKQAAPANLSFTLRQMDGRADIILEIANRIDASVKLDLVMYVPIAGGMRAVRTSSCPLLPPQGGLPAFTGIESWPHPVMMIAISDIHILPAGAARVCE